MSGVVEQGDEPETLRWFSRDACENVVTRVLAMSAGGGKTSVEIGSWWNGELRWARNRVSVASDRRDVLIRIKRTVRNGEGQGETNQLDDISLESAVRVAERRARDTENLHRLLVNDLSAPQLPAPETMTWSDVTSGVTANTRGQLARLLVEDAEAAGMMSSGYLEMRAGTLGRVPYIASGAPFRADVLRFDRWTQAQCSMTVRHPKGTASGWAGTSSHAWDKIDGAALAKVALRKCLSSVDPVRVEPGRYMVILESQAVCQLLDFLMDMGTLDRGSAEVYGLGTSPFWLGRDTALRTGKSKIGLTVVDKRITISHDPSDPMLGVLPAEGLRPITWIDRGVLNTMHHDHAYARREFHQVNGNPYRPSFRVSGGTATVDEMIRTTTRGLLVTRFSQTERLDWTTLMCTGITRDGLWLIENGKISKAVKNMRFTDSPLFMLNNIEQLGVPALVFRPTKSPTNAGLTSAIVPPMKVRDFSFTSLVDAV